MQNATGTGTAMPADLRYRLAGLILAETARAGLGAGSRLPTERKLAADMGATRTSIRHALAVLQAQGHISREVGRGTFLRHDPGADGHDAGTAQAGPAGGRAHGAGAAAAGPIAGLAAWPVRPRPASRPPTS